MYQHSCTRVYETIYRLQHRRANEPFKRYTSSPREYLPGTILLHEEELYAQTKIISRDASRRFATLASLRS